METRPEDADLEYDPMDEIEREERREERHAGALDEALRAADYYGER